MVTKWNYRFFHKRIEVVRVFGDNLKTSRTFWNLHHGAFFHACKTYFLLVSLGDLRLVWKAILWHGFRSLSDGPRQRIFFLFWKIFYSTEKLIVRAFPFCLWLLGQDSRPKIKWRLFNYWPPCRVCARNIANLLIFRLVVRLSPRGIIYD